jgi:hypothetical protein
LNLKKSSASSDPGAQNQHVAIVRYQDGTKVFADPATRLRLGALPFAPRDLVTAPASIIREAGTGEGSFMARQILKPSVLDRV